MEKVSKRKDKKISSPEHHQVKRSRPCQTIEDADSNILYSTNSSEFWDSIPVNVMITIFQELPVPDLAQCALTCSYWRDILQDDYVWRQLFLHRWHIDPKVSLRKDIKESSWLSEYKRLHLIETGPATITSSVHHGEKVVDLLFSRSGRYLCTSSQHIVVIWSVGDSIEILNKLYISCEEEGNNNIEDDLESGIRSIEFNETDEFFLVFGRKLQVRDCSNSDKFSQILVYTFPDCSLIKTVQSQEVYAETNLCWFSRYTFLLTVSNSQPFLGILTLRSVQQYQPKELVNIDYDINWVTVINNKDSLQKLIVFSYVDEESHDDVEYAFDCHKISCFVTHSDLSVKQLDFSGKESKYWSPDPSHYSCEPFPVIDKHLERVIGNIACDTVTDNFGVVCRPVKDKSANHAGMYSNEKLDFRIFDLKMNLVKVVPLQSMAPPQLFLDHDYWFDERLNSMMISGDLNPGLLHYYDIHYDVHVKKNTGHTEALNCAAFCPSSPFLLCTVSEDNLVKFWDYRQYSRHVNSRYLTSKKS